mmetsp:Transcript_74084/g.240884  ORF Transcript_74084/g.240884 Transcript_74084/m.240884 type:complete len:109 (+) Transcript_74084:330-656(+)
MFPMPCLGLVLGHRLDFAEQIHAFVVGARATRTYVVFMAGSNGAANRVVTQSQGLLQRFRSRIAEAHPRLGATPFVLYTQDVQDWEHDLCLNSNGVLGPVACRGDGDL